MSASVCTFICSHVDVYIIVVICVQYIVLLVGRYMCLFVYVCGMFVQSIIPTCMYGRLLSGKWPSVLLE